MTQIKDISVTKTVASANDFLVLQSPTGETYNIKKSDFLAGLSSGGGTTPTPTPTPTEVSLSYVSNGDINGLLYYIGTNRRTQPWQNPQGTGLVITVSGAGGGGGLQTLSDRQESAFYGDNTLESWVKLDFGTVKLRCNYYSLRNRNLAQHYLRNWKLQGSNNDVDWVDLDTQTNNTILNNPSQWLSIPVTNNAVSFSKFRLLQTGFTSDNSYFICLGEIELYGFVS